MSQPAFVSSSAPLDRRVRLGLALLLLAIAAAWSNSFAVPFLFDDITSIGANESICHLWPLVPGPLAPPVGGETVSGRPLLNLTFALNYAVSGHAVWSHHALNLVLHAAAALVLFGLVRRTLRSAPLRDRFGADPDWLALAIAALWALHPLQTESVTYLVQRAESLAALLAFATLYAFARGWFVAAFLACLAGMAAKETTVVVPVLAALYARCFLAANWREAWKNFRTPLLALAATWLLLAALLATFGNRGGTAGLGTASSLDYALAQPAAILRYVRLAFWPQPLVFDYGQRTPAFDASAFGALLVVLTLLGATLWALGRRPALGFAGAAFFLLLAPSSSVVPVASQFMAEHRFYAALALVAAALVLGAYRWLGRAALVAGAALALVAALATHARNRVYQSDLALWTDVVAHAPHNARAWVNHGLALEATGRQTDALESFANAVALEPVYPFAHNNYGLALLHAGRISDAVHEFELALAQNPRLAAAHFNRANSLLALGRTDDAIAGFEAALRLQPKLADVRLNLGSALHRARRYVEAEAVNRALLAEQPDSVAAHCNLASTLFATRREPEALDHLARATTLAPGNLTARVNYGTALAVTGRPAEAVAQFRAAVALRRDDPGLLLNYAAVLAQSGDAAAARTTLDRLLALQPGNADARRLLEQLR
ncbi:MAG: tetratricopeptide repeat protein [Opitutae bacterium]|nr:tetratricopeptide repeat protein [Opitutae bacterium]